MTINATTKRLQTLEEHRTLLKEVLTSAQQRVVIVSPFISNKAIKADNLSILVKQAVGRGVQVLVFVDYKLNTIDGEMKLSAKEGIADMVKSGARVYIADGIHNKTLICNNDLIAEGSFNWLSAVRAKNGENQREERTFVYTGQDASKMIEQEMSTLESVSYGEAGIKAKDERSEDYQRLGVKTLLGLILFIPLLTGKDFADKVVGVAITIVLLACLIWLAKLITPSSDEPQKTSHKSFINGTDSDNYGIYSSEYNPEYNNMPGGICTGPNVYGNNPGDVIGPKMHKLPPQ